MMLRHAPHTVVKFDFVWLAELGDNITLVPWEIVGSLELCCSIRCHGSLQGSVRAFSSTDEREGERGERDAYRFDGLSGDVSHDGESCLVLHD